MVDGVKCYDTDRLGNPITTTTTYDAVSLNGVAGTYVSTPDSVANSITGDIDIRVKAALTDWTPAAANTLASKFLTTGNQRSFIFYVNSSGCLAFYGSVDGTTLLDHPNLTPTGFSDGTTNWCRMTRLASTGVITYYTSSDGATWVQLGATVAGTSGTLYNSTAIVELGAYQTGAANPLSGKIYQAQIYNGINGTLAVDFNASRYAGGTTLTGSTGEVYTLNGSAVIHPTNYPIVGYVPWEAQSSIVLQSNAFTTTWTAIGTPAATQNAIGPDGATSAWTLTDNDAAAMEYIYSGSINLTAAAYTFSVYVKKTTGAQTSYPVVYFIDDAITTLGLATIDTTNGIATLWTAYTAFSVMAGGSARCTSHNADYWRVELTGTGTAVGWTVRLAPAGSLTAIKSTGTVDLAAQGSAVFYGAMVNLGAFAGPYIPTTTIAVARNLDVARWANNGVISSSVASGYIEWTPLDSNGAWGTRYLGGTAIDGSNYVNLYYSAGVLTLRKTVGGVNKDATLSLTTVAGTKYKVAWTFDTMVGTNLYANGVKGTGNADATALPIGTYWYVGVDGTGVAAGSGAHTHDYMWNRRLSDSEAKAITS
jgi:hypothetical protein